MDWHIAEHGSIAGWVSVCDRGGNEVARVKGGAHAHLIVEAPKLLRALRQLYRSIGGARCSHAETCANCNTQALLKSLADVGGDH